MEAPRGPAVAAPGRALWLAAAALQALAASGSVVYSKLNAGETCADYLIPEVATESDCFTLAAPAVGLGGKTTFRLDSMSFRGCMYNSQSDVVFFGVSTENQALATFEYICAGSPSTTTSTSTTSSRTSTMTVTVTTTTKTGTDGVYSLINADEVCADYQLPEVTTSAICFNQAVTWIGLQALPTVDGLIGFGFTGCVLNTVSNQIFFGSDSVTSPNPNIKHICDGYATTTTTTTSSTITVSTTTISTTSTFTTSTSTVSTITLTSTTVTATTSTTSTTSATTSTSTATTSTATTETTTTTSKTSSTSTYTGSSSTSFTWTTTTETETTTTSTTFTTTTFTYTTTTTVTASTTTFTAGAPGAGFVGDDPITFHNNIVRRFWLPERELVPLLQTPEMQLLGSAWSHGDEQWITRLELRGPRGEPVLTVAIKDNIEAFNQSAVGPDTLGTLNITFDYIGGMQLVNMPSPDDYAHQWTTVAFAFGWVPHFKIGEARAEMLVVDGQTARIVVMSTAALGFEGPESHLAARYAHLDFVLQVRQRDTCEGLLPELWGFKPVSNATAALLY